MRIVEHTNFKELFPDEGKVLADGKDIATAVAVPINADISKWTEIDEGEAAEYEEITDTEALNIILNGNETK